MTYCTPHHVLSPMKRRDLRPFFYSRILIYNFHRKSQSPWACFKVIPYQYDITNSNHTYHTYAYQGYDISSNTQACIILRRTRRLVAVVWSNLRGEHEKYKAVGKTIAHEACQTRLSRKPPARWTLPGMGSLACTKPPPTEQCASS